MQLCFHIHFPENNFNTEIPNIDKTLFELCSEENFKYMFVLLSNQHSSLLISTLVIWGNFYISEKNESLRRMKINQKEFFLRTIKEKQTEL